MTIENPNKIYQQLSIGQKLIIELFDPGYDFGRPIPSWELKLKITKGKRPIYADKSCYSQLNSLINLGILTKLKGTTNYMLTRLGEEIRKLILPKLNESIPPIANERITFIQSQVSKINLFSANDNSMKAWAERYLLDTQRFSTVIQNESEAFQKRFVSALGLTAWNTFYQPILVKTQDFIDKLKLNEKININHFNVICHFFDWKFYQLENDLWFICKNLNFWKERYSDLFRYNLNQTSKKELINNSTDLKNIEQQTKEVLKSGKLAYKTIGDLTKEISLQKGHYWDEKYIKDVDWIRKRLNLIL